MKYKIQYAFGLALLIMVASACKKKSKSEETITPTPVVPAASVLTVENTTPVSVKIQAGAKMSVQVKMKASSIINSLTVTLINGSVKSVLLDSLFATDAEERTVDYGFKLKKYPQSKLQLLVVTKDKKGDTLQRIINLDYFNKLSFVVRASIQRSGSGYPYSGYDLINNKYIDDYDGPEFSVMYKQNTNDNFYPVLSAGKGNGATFAICNFSVADSLVTVDMVNDIIGTLSFTATVPVTNDKMMILLKHPTNKFNKPWSLLSVWYYNTFTQNGSSWTRGDVNMDIFEYPINY